MNLQGLDIGSHRFFFRPETSDAAIINAVFGTEPEYDFPEFDAEHEPKNILDIGANIGVTAVALALNYPNAKIFAFEPDPVNFEILQKNTKPYHNIQIFPFAVSNEKGVLTLYDSTDPLNFGGKTFHDFGADKSKGHPVEMRRMNEVLAELGLTKVELIKMDCEGSEPDIIKAFSKEFLAGVVWICGELHGRRDFELLQYLEDAGFAVQAIKPLEQVNFNFHAARKE